MKKFKVKYYEMAMDKEQKNMFDKVMEKEIEADYFEIKDGMLIFNMDGLRTSGNSNLAAFRHFISVEVEKEKDN